jgi:hypothetical protein
MGEVKRKQLAIPLAALPPVTRYHSRLNAQQFPIQYLPS